MVSKPSFDPNNVSENWDALNNDENSSLLNRATLGRVYTGVDIQAGDNTCFYAAESRL